MKLIQGIIGIVVLLGGTVLLGILIELIPSNLPPIMYAIIIAVGLTFILTLGFGLFLDATNSGRNRNK